MQQEDHVEPLALPWTVHGSRRCRPVPTSVSSPPRGTCSLASPSTPASSFAMFTIIFVNPSVSPSFSGHASTSPCSVTSPPTTSTTSVAFPSRAMSLRRWPRTTRIDSSDTRHLQPQTPVLVQTPATSVLLSDESSSAIVGNASSDHRATFGSCMDDDHERHNLASDCEATVSSGIYEDIFMFDKLDELNEGSNCQQRSLSPTRTVPEETSSIENYVKNTRWDLDMGSIQTANLASSFESGHCRMAKCTRCRKLFNVMDVDGCEECTLRVGVFSANPEIHTTEESHKQHHKPCIPSETSLAVPGCVEDSSETSLDHRPVINERPGDCSPGCPTQYPVDTTQGMKDLTENKRLHAIGDSSLGNSNEMSSHGINVGNCQLAKSTFVEYDHFRDQNGKPNHGMPKCLSELYCQGNEFVSGISTSDSHKSTSSPSSKVDIIEGTGVSVLLLPKSSSNIWPVVEGRPLAATSILCSEPYYARDKDNTMRHIIQCDNSSVESSVDVGSSRQYDVRLEHLKSSKHGDLDKSQIGSTVSHQSIASVSDTSISGSSDLDKPQIGSTVSRQSIASVSDTSISGSSVSFCPQHDLNDACYPIIDSENNASGTIISAGEYGSCNHALSSAIDCWSVAQAIVNDDSEAVKDVVIQNQMPPATSIEESLQILCFPTYGNHDG
uniref:Uncharacterized protein n=1 Tax=Avena sativa TaxID=4498 RepID=A0ACD6AT09_AVESA